MKQVAENKSGLKILRTILQKPSITDSFTLNEITEIVESDESSIYRNIKALVPQSNEIWSNEYLFCVEDLFNRCSRNSPTINILSNKLRLSYNYFLQWEWEKVTRSILPDKDSDNKKIIKFEKDPGNYIKITLDKSANKNKDKATIIISKQLDPSNKVEDFGVRENEPLITNVPLKHFYKDSKLYIKTLLLKSCFKIKGETNFLRCMPSQKGLRKIQDHYYERIKQIYNNPDYSAKKKNEKINKLIQRRDSEILDLGNNTRNYTLSPITKSLLQYALWENDYDEFNNSIQSLSDSDSDIVHERVLVRQFNEFGEADNGMLRPFTFKRDFPYLLKYTLVKDYLPKDFVVKLLKNIALELMDKLHDFNGEELNYMVSKWFIESIDRDVLNNNKIKIDENKLEAIRDYREEISIYTKYVDLRKSEKNKEIENWKDIIRKEDNLCQELIKDIEDGINKGKEVIPIFNQIRRAKVLYDSERHILEEVVKRYGEKYLVISTCLVRKSKARKLRTLLRGKPNEEKGHSSLIENGIPKECITEEFLHKLGYYTDISRPDYTNPFINEIRKKNRLALYGILPPFIPIK